MKRHEDDDLVDEMADDSFPASDPPSWVGGPPVASESLEPNVSPRGSGYERRPRMDVPGMQRSQEEGPVARRIERETSRLPSDLFLWTGLAAMATSLGFMAAGKKQTSVFVGMWVPTILLFGVYNKIVKIAGSDVYRRELH